MEDVGKKGEELTMLWLLENGYDLQHSNWRNGRYELDVVAIKDDTIHFVEVKTRSINYVTSPQDAITKRKFNALRRAASAYIMLYNIDLEPQFDLMTVLHDNGQYVLNYIPNAMYCKW